MKFEENERFLRKRAQKLFEDSLSHPGVRLDQRVIKTISGLLSFNERENAEFAAAVVTGRKLLVVCDHPERIKEAVLMDGRDPAKVFRWRLGLKGKKHTRDA